jgi:hypothetical protein
MPKPQSQCQTSSFHPKRDLPSTFLTGAPALHTANITAIQGSISTRLAINSVKTLARTTGKRANWPKIKHLDGLSTHPDRRFLLSGAGLRRLAGNPVLTDSSAGTRKSWEFRGPCRAGVGLGARCGFEFSCVVELLLTGRGFAASMGITPIKRINEVTIPPMSRGCRE